MISLILATVGRKDELDRCIESILKQKNMQYEIIIIDQNPPMILNSLRKKYHGDNIQWVCAEYRGLSRARNDGLKRKRFNKVALIDDDSVLQNEYHLFSAVKLLEKYDFVSGMCINPDGTPANSFFPIQDTEISKENIFSCIMSPCFFFRTPVNREFDLKLGVGAIFGSSEETDFAITLILDGGKGLFKNDVTVVHPEGDLKLFSQKRRYNYALGVGALMRKRFNFFGPKTVSLRLFGPVLNVVRSVTRFEFKEAWFFMIDFYGRWCGFLRYR